MTAFAKKGGNERLAFRRQDDKRRYRDWRWALKDRPALRKKERSPSRDTVDGWARDAAGLPGGARIARNTSP